MLIFWKQFHIRLGVKYFYEYTTKMGLVFNDLYDHIVSISIRLRNHKKIFYTKLLHRIYPMVYTSKQYDKPFLLLFKLEHLVIYNIHFFTKNLSFF